MKEKCSDENNTNTNGRFGTAAYHINYGRTLYIYVSLFCLKCRKTKIRALSDGIAVSYKAAAHAGIYKKHF